MYITLPCSCCGEMTEFACSSCRQPMCCYCTRPWPAANGKPGATRGYRCIACEKGLRAPVTKQRAAAPTVTRSYYCGCGAPIAQVATKRWTERDDERVKWAHLKHHKQAQCKNRALGCEFTYTYEDGDPRATPRLSQQLISARAHQAFRDLLDGVGPFEED